METSPSFSASVCTVTHHTAALKSFSAMLMGSLQSVDCYAKKAMDLHGALGC